MANGVEGDSLRHQELVKFNVGQVPFVMTRETLNRYPDSKLSKLVGSYGEAVENGEYLYVDRDPKSFPWILEIYRGGRYKTVIPDMLMEELESDLAFYRLPSLAELEVQLEKPMDPIRAELPPLSLLFREVVSKMARCGAIYMLPLDVIVYYECEEGGLAVNSHKILIAPLSETKFKDDANPENHEGLLKVLLEGCADRDRQTFDWGKKLFVQRTKKEYWILDFSDETKRELLNKEAAKWDMEVTFESRSFGSPGRDMTLNALVVQYRGSKRGGISTSKPGSEDVLGFSVKNFYAAHRTMWSQRSGMYQARSSS